MYHNCDDFRILASNPDFLTALIATLYPTTDLSPEENCKSKLLKYF